MKTIAEEIDQEVTCYIQTLLSMYKESEDANNFSDNFSCGRNEAHACVLEIGTPGFVESEERNDYEDEDPPEFYLQIEISPFEFRMSMELQDFEIGGSSYCEYYQEFENKKEGMKDIRTEEFLEEVIRRAKKFPKWVNCRLS